MENDDELDAVLIDAFDADPPTLTDTRPPVDAYKAPIRDSHAPIPTTIAPVVALRHYPSLDDLGSPAVAKTPPPPRPAIAREDPVPITRSSEAPAPTVRYPRWLSTSADAILATPSPSSTRIEAERNTGDGHDRPPHQYHNDQSSSDVSTYEDPRVGKTEASMTDQSSEPTTRQSPPRRMEPPTDEEIAHQQRLLQAEIKRFQGQADYIALALAGETPHQIEARRLREEERKEREERRLAAMETRVLNVIEREHQREARQLERRLRHAERTHRSSVSPSPEREDDDEEDDQPEPLQAPQVSQEES